MWLKILKYTVIVARHLGLVDKVRDFVGDKLNNIDKRIDEVDVELDKGEK